MNYTIDPTITDITDVKVQTFSDSFLSRVTNTGGRFSKYVTTVPVGGVYNIDQMGGIELRQLNELYPKIENANMLLDRRTLQWDRYGESIWVDEAQIKEMIEDPTGKWGTKLLEAYNRLKDRLILLAAIGSVNTGVNGGTTLTAAQDGVLTVDASAGLTYDLLLSLSQNFINNSAYDNIMGSPILTLTGKENTALMKEADFTTTASLNKLAYNFDSMVQREGFVIKKMGEFDVIVSSGDITARNNTLPIVPYDATYRYNVAMLPGAVTLGIGLEPKLEIVRLPDRYNTIVVKFSCGMGAVRNQGEMVQILKTVV